ncbi:hypothetical protein [Limnohabitans sp. Bal53]|uniref:hypothetical protein n=1 Tax=Limnohabitans sp. Bal53 TaxID=1977910 RepID=UPI000D3CE5EF|nr:hypothetical protein [Limnohabitans sp. Bal53]PUE41435.1 hypothetical protein B9Z50_06935 [Limnohabitans sp. Bal53]
MIEINIRLDVRDQDNTPADITLREIQALAILGECFHHRADYLDHGQSVPRLVAGLDSFDADTLRQLANELHQDCVAVFHPDQHRGELLGPCAAAWGEFDLARFQRLDLVTAYGETTGFGWDQSDTERFRARRAA